MKNKANPTVFYSLVFFYKPMKLNTINFVI